MESSKVIENFHSLMSLLDEAKLAQVLQELQRDRMRVRRESFRDNPKEREKRIKALSQKRYDNDVQCAKYRMKKYGFSKEKVSNERDTLDPYDYDDLKLTLFDEH